MTGGWRDEGQSLLTGIAGGAIVGMPLLYTMEIWRSGVTLGGLHLIGLLLVVVIVNTLFCHLSGFRERFSWLDATLEGVTSVGIAVVLSGFILVLLRKIGATTSLADAAGMITCEASVVSVGVSFANRQVRHRDREGTDDDKRPAPQDPAQAQLRQDVRDVVAALVGSLVFALNVAPTEEVLLVASRLQPGWLLALLGFELLLCYVILYAAGFRRHRVHVESLFQSPPAETALTCAISLVVAFLLLLVIGFPETRSGVVPLVASTLVLGLPAVVGGAAGRLIV